MIKVKVKPEKRFNVTFTVFCFNIEWSVWFGQTVFG